MLCLNKKRFLDHCEHAATNPRAKGYKDHRRSIQKFQKNGIWKALSSRKLSLEEIKALSYGYDIAESTIRSWNQNLLKNKSWLPLHRRLNPSENQFTPNEEIVIAEMIRHVIEEIKVPLDNDIIRRAITTFFYDTHPIEIDDQTNYEKLFNASTHYISKFKKRHQFSRRKFRKRKRSKSTASSIIKFFKELENVLNCAEKRRILNVDETCWRINDSGEYTWARTGADSVEVNSCSNEKENFICLATIDANEFKHPLVLLSKGTTELVESNWFGSGRNIMKVNLKQDLEAQPLVNPFPAMSKTRRKETNYYMPNSLTDHSESGWTTQPTWLRYLYNLRYNFCPPDEDTDFYDQVNTIYLLCDSYSVHFCKEAIKFAKMLNIVLIKIPESTTDLFQPLDCMVFGALKNRSRTFFNTKTALEILDLFEIDELLHATVTNLITPIRKQESTVVLDIYWYELPEELIIKAWQESLLSFFDCYFVDHQEHYSLNEEEIHNFLESKQINDSEQDDDASNDEELEEEQFEPFILTDESIAFLKEKHSQYINEFELRYIKKKANDKKKSIERQEKAINKLLHDYDKKMKKGKRIILTQQH